MFENALLESSSDRIAVLSRRHWILAMLAGLGGFLVAWKLLPLLLFIPNPRTLLWQSQLAGVALALDALMVCYVSAATRMLRLNRVGWTAATVLFSFAGFLAFLVHAAQRTGDWKRATVPLAYILESVLLRTLIIVPLIRTQALGLEELSRRWQVVPSPPPPPAVSLMKRATSPHVTAVKMDGDLIVPARIPTRIDLSPGNVAPLQPPDFGVIGGYGIPGGTQDGVIGGLPPALLTTPPPPTARAAERKQIRIKVGGQVEAARAIFQPPPEYPALAKIARIQGVVRLEAVISTDGRIQDLKLIIGHPLLVHAAREALARWRYQPTLLNGEPVEVLTEIDVKFQLPE